MYATVQKLCNTLALVLVLVLCDSLLFTTSSSTSSPQWELKKSFCEDMRPPGNLVPQRSPSPYFIKVDWTVRDVVIIHVYGFYSFNHTYKGILIQVRANATPIGTFSREIKRMILFNCPPGKRNLVYNMSRQKYYESAVIWRPPPEYLIMANIAIHVTVIKERGIFWHMKRTIPYFYGSTTTEFRMQDEIFLYRDSMFPLMVHSNRIKSDYYYSQSRSKVV